jgi:hypothetical protein
MVLQRDKPKNRNPLGAIQPEVKESNDDLFSAPASEVSRARSQFTCANQQEPIRPDFMPGGYLLPVQSR